MPFPAVPRTPGGRTSARDRDPVERRVVVAAVIGLVVLVGISALSWLASNDAEHRQEQAALAVDRSIAMTTHVERIAIDVDRLFADRQLDPAARSDLAEAVQRDARQVRLAVNQLSHGGSTFGFENGLPASVAAIMSDRGEGLGRDLTEYANGAEAVVARPGGPTGEDVRSVDEHQAVLVPKVDTLTRELVALGTASNQHLRDLQLLSVLALAIVAVAEIVLIFLPLARALGRQRKATISAIAESHRRERALTVRMAEIEAIGEAVGAVLREEDAREAVVQVVLEITGAAAVSLLEVSSDGLDLVVTASAGIDMVGVRTPVAGTSLAARVLRMGAPMYIPDLVSHPDIDRPLTLRIEEHIGEQLTQGVYLPILRDGRPFAELVVTYSVEHAGREDVLPTLSVLASEAAVAIRHQDFQRQLEELARLDPLTGVDNRRAWQDNLREALSRADRNGEPVCVAMLDLDFFKAYNDAHGHAGGDELLVAVADAWGSRLRDGDVLARLGGEEFAVLLTGCELGAAVGVIESLRAQVPFGQTTSAGLAQWDRYETPDQLLAAADAALYAAKAAGRDQTHLRRSAGDLVAARDPGRVPAATGVPFAG